MDKCFIKYSVGFRREYEAWRSYFALTYNDPGVTFDVLAAYDFGPETMKAILLAGEKGTTKSGAFTDFQKEEGLKPFGYGRATYVEGDSGGGGEQSSTSSFLGFSGKKSFLDLSEGSLVLEEFGAEDKHLHEEEQERERRWLRAMDRRAISPPEFNFTEENLELADSGETKNSFLQGDPPVEGVPGPPPGPPVEGVPGPPPGPPVEGVPGPAGGGSPPPAAAGGMFQEAESSLQHAVLQKVPRIFISYAKRIFFFQGEGGAGMEGGGGCGWSWWVVCGVGVVVGGGGGDGVTILISYEFVENLYSSTFF